jgi:hypothetical protein
MLLHTGTPQAFDLRIALSTGSFRDVLSSMLWWKCSYGARVSLVRGLGSSVAVCDSMLPMRAVEDPAVDIDVLAVRHPGVDDDSSQQLLQRFLSAGATSGSSTYLEFDRDLSSFGLSTVSRLVRFVTC